MFNIIYIGVFRFINIGFTTIFITDFSSFKLRLFDLTKFIV